MDKRKTHIKINELIIIVKNSKSLENIRYDMK